MTLPGHLIGFADALRAEGVAIGTSELNDAFAALGEVEWTRAAPFKEALAATMAKSPDDRRVFDLVFERYFFRATEGAAIESGIREGDAQQRGAEDGERIDFDALREQILEAIRAGDEAALRDLARLAIAAFGRRGEGSGVLGVDVQRIRRALGLKSEPSGLVKGEGAPQELPLTRDQIRRFEAHLRRELERAQIERTQALPPSRPLNELDRALPSGPAQDLAAVHRVVMQLKRRLASQGQQARGHTRHAHVDVRKTMRASLETGGVPVVLKYKPKRPRRPELYVLCDVSTSVTSASRLLPVRPARPARQLPQDALASSSSSASPRSPTSSSASAPSRRSTTRSPRTPASPTSPATPTTAASGASSCTAWRTTCTRARP